MSLEPGSLVRLSSDAGLDQGVYGKVGQWIEERGRWSVQLSNGAPCAARPDQLVLLGIETGAQVQVAVREGMEVSAEVLGWVEERKRWAVRLSTGQEAAARIDQLTLTAPPGANPGGIPPPASQTCCQHRSDPSTDAQNENPNAGCSGKDQEIWDGILDEESKMLVELVANTGLGNWEAKRAAITEKLGKDVGSSSAAELEKKWQSIAPTVKSVIKDKPVMPCGHSCNTCPTKANCHLEGIFDMEDFGVERKLVPAI